MSQREARTLSDPGASLTELVEEARGGSSAAWDELVDRLGDVVWSISCSYGISPQDGVDIGQLVWLQLVRRLDTIADPERLDRWLSTTTHRQCLAFVKQRDREHRQLTWRVPMGRPDLLDVEEVVVDEEVRRRLWAALEQLPSGCQAMLRLFLADPEPSYDDVAHALAIPINSIGPRRRRCLQKLLRAAQL